MAHTHSHGHVHEAPKDYSNAFAIGVALNLGFVVVEGVYGVLSHSLALLADAGHNFGDVLGLLLAWAASIMVKTLPTKRRTYGLRSSSILAALINAVLLLVAIGGIVWESIRRFAHPEPVDGSTVMFVALAGIVVNSVTAWLFISGTKHDLNIRGAFVHMAADAVVSLAVVVTGLVILKTGWLWLDPAISLLVVAVILWSTWGLLRDSTNLALDAVPAHINFESVFSYFESQPQVKGVHDLHIWGMSTIETALTVHLVLSDNKIDDKFTTKLSDELREKFGICHSTIQFETPDMNCCLEPADVI